MLGGSVLHARGALTARVRAGAFVVVTGGPGAGKSALAERAIRDAGYRPVVAGALATQGDVPFFGLMRALGRGFLQGTPREVATQFRQGLDRADVPLLDDLQWADAGTLATLEFLAGSGPVVGCVRRGDAGEQVARRAAQNAGAEFIELGCRETEATSLPTRLTPRERETLEFVAAGCSSGEIAANLGIAPATVDAFVLSARRKLGARTRIQASLLAAGL